MNVKNIVWFIKAISYFVLLRSLGIIIIILITFLCCCCYRETKEEARATIESCFASPALESHGKDPLWTPGQWRERESGSSSDDDSSAEKDRSILQVYNKAMSNIASLTDTKVEPLTFRLVSEWDLATTNERASCLMSCCV